MVIPTASNFPTSFDDNTNLHEVHDALRVRLAEDYNPGDTFITVEGNNTNFPTTGLLTLTEQCSDIDDRAISFYYGLKTETTFEQIQLLPGFSDVTKPKGATNVTQNVMATHHNALKDALIAIQEFIGIEGTTDTQPFGETLEGRINFLTKLVFTPRAWFTIDKRIGLVPLCVTVTDQSFRLKCDDDETVMYLWDFGDECISGISEISVISTINATSTVPLSAKNVIVKDLDGGSLQKCYTCPGRYSISLTVSNQYGEDTLIFKEIVTARTEAPDPAVIDFIPKTTQNFTAGAPVGGPYTTPPTVRAVANSFIEIEIPSGKNPATGRSYAGEELDTNNSPIDPITTYTWNLGDDILHSNLQTTRAAYSVGGIYDLELRVDTKFGAFRITSYEDAIDIIERQNLWLWSFQTQDGVGGGTVKAHEFGLVSETFKAAGSSLTIDRDNSFLDFLSASPYHEDAEVRAKNEFARNVHFAPQGTTGSGDSGAALLFWASGGSDVANQTVNIRSFNGFDDTYSTLTAISAMPWNWAALDSGDEVFFVFGTQEHTTPSGTNLSNPQKVKYDLSTTTPTVSSLSASSFNNGAQQLLQHPSTFDSGVPTNGFFATYRSAWKDNTGFLLRNSAVNEFFRITSFYKTEGTLVNPFVTMTKLQDMLGPTKTEGQLVTLSTGLFFFNNSGEISAYNDLSDTWEVANPSLASVTFRSLQDTDVSGFDNKSNRLMAASDKDRIAYLSYDYSTKAFIKFNGADLTFSALAERPSGSQFLLGVF